MGPKGIRTSSETQDAHVRVLRDRFRNIFTEQNMATTPARFRSTAPVLPRRNRTRSGQLPSRKRRILFQKEGIVGQSRATAGERRRWAPQGSRVAPDQSVALAASLRYGAVLPLVLVSLKRDI
jgi:hypothetical protein